jgi:hypothetical protein
LAIGDLDWRFGLAIGDLDWRLAIGDSDRRLPIALDH